MNCRSIARRPVGSCSSKASMSVISSGRAASEGLQDQARMIRTSQRDILQPLQGRAQVAQWFTSSDQ
jgi:hypothetical protein